MNIDVLHVVPAFYPTRGGIEVLVENLTTTLNSFSLRTHGVLAPRSAGERPDIQTIGNTLILSVDTPGPESFRQFDKRLNPIIDDQRELAQMLMKTRAQLLQVQPSLIHIHGLSPLGTVTSALAESLNIPMVLHLHGDVTGTLPLHMRSRIQTCAAVLTVSEFVQDSIRSHCGRVVGVRVIRNGLPDPTNAGIAMRDHVGPPTITMIGRLEVSKGFDDGLKACSLLIQEHPDLIVNIVGVGAEEANLRNLAVGLNLCDNVIFHGRLEQAQTWQLIQDSSCILIPSLAYEGFSLVALESAYLERPVVANELGGLPETVIHGETGTIVRPGDIASTARALRAYVADSRLAKRHGQFARTRALLEFSAERFGQEIDEFHDHILRCQPDLVQSAGR